MSTFQRLHSNDASNTSTPTLGLGVAVTTPTSESEWNDASSGGYDYVGHQDGQRQWAAGGQQQSEQQHQRRWQTAEQQWSNRPQAAQQESYENSTRQQDFYGSQRQELSYNGQWQGEEVTNKEQWQQESEKLQRQPSLPIPTIKEPVPDTKTERTAPWQGHDIWAIAPLAVIEDDSHDLGRTRRQRVGYLEGLRGLLAIEVLLYIFFRVLAPAIATDTDTQGIRPAAFVGTAPAWQNALRKGVGTLFWDSTLPGAFFIILSARVASLTFLERRTPTSLAGAVFRRPIRFVLPIAVALGVVSILLAAKGFSHVNHFGNVTSNDVAKRPQQWKSFIEYFNSIFTMFFVYSVSTTDAAFAFLPPAGLSWIVPIIFQQTFPLYLFSAILPYLTLRTKLLGFAAMITVMYWEGTWGWYTVSGLQIAEFSLVYLPVMSTATKWWLRAAAFVFFGLGVALKYLFAFVPSLRYKELDFHPSMSDGVLNTTTTAWYATDPYPRTDDYLLAFGFMVLLELTPILQRVFNNPVLKYFARLSFLLFLTSGTVCLSLGSTLFVYLTETKGYATDSTAVLGILFAACVGTSIAVAEVGYWLVEWPTNVFARRAFVFMRD